MVKQLRFLQGETLFQWHGSKPPTLLNDASLPHGGSVCVPEDFQGFAVRGEFARGRLPIDQFVKGDKRFIEPIGFTSVELARDAELGYFRHREDDPPRPITSLAQEMSLRAAGVPLLSPRDGDRVVEWDFREGGIPGRLIALFQHGVVMSAERGRGDARPQLMSPPDECLSAGELRTTTKTREESIAHGNVFGSQTDLFSGARPLPSPASPANETRDYLHGH